jgi:hypothetical protein
MAILRSALNGGVAEVDDETAVKLIESGHWVKASSAPTKPRATRARKAAPVEEPKPEE